MTQNAPKPESLSAFLVPDGLPHYARRATPHEYVETLPVTIEGRPMWSHVFQCRLTGARKVWGIEDRGDHVSAPTASVEEPDTDPGVN